jgi:predicted amidohydrolase
MVRFAVAQVDCVTADLKANLENCMSTAATSARMGVDLVVFPELCLTGVSILGSVPDLALRRDARELRALTQTTCDGPSLMIGYVEDGGDGFYYNSTAYLEGGSIVHIQRKIYLPAYGPFDEGRAFCSGNQFRAFPTRFGRAAMLICEDAWHTALPYIAVSEGAVILLTASASPAGGTSTDVSSHELWTTVNRANAITLKCFNVYANRIGMEGHLEYWGGSHIISPSGQFLAQGPTGVEAIVVADVYLNSIPRERYGYRYVQDERLDLTLRELARVATNRWG